MTNTFGLLWYDPDPKKDWRHKVKDAAARLEAKKWVKANIAYVSHLDVGLSWGLYDEIYVETLDGIEIYANYITNPNYCWVAHNPTKVLPKPVIENQAAPGQLALL